MSAPQWELATELLEGWPHYDLVLNNRAVRRWHSPDLWTELQFGKTGDSAILRTLCDGAVSDYNQRQRLFDPLPFARAVLPDSAIRISGRASDGEEHGISVRHAMTEAMVRTFAEFERAGASCMVCGEQRALSKAFCNDCNDAFFSLHEKAFGNMPTAGAWEWICRRRAAVMQRTAAFSVARALLPLEWRDFPWCNSWGFFHPCVPGSTFTIDRADSLCDVFEWVGRRVREPAIPERRPRETARMLLPEHLWKARPLGQDNEFTLFADRSERVESRDFWSQTPHDQVVARARLMNSQIQQFNPFALARQLLSDKWKAHQDSHGVSFRLGDTGISVTADSTEEWVRATCSTMQHQTAPARDWPAFETAVEILGRKWRVIDAIAGIRGPRFLPPDFSPMAGLGRTGRGFSEEDVVTLQPGSTVDSVRNACQIALERYFQRCDRGPETRPVTTIEHPIVGPLSCQSCGGDIGKGLLINGLCTYCNQRLQLATAHLEPLRHVNGLTGISKLDLDPKPADTLLGDAWQSPDWEEP